MQPFLLVASTSKTIEVQVQKCSLPAEADITNMLYFRLTSMLSLKKKKKAIKNIS